MTISIKFKALFLALLVGFSLIGCGGGGNDDNAPTSPTHLVSFYDENLDFIENKSIAENANVSKSSSWYKAEEDSPTYSINSDVRLYAVQNVTEITTQEELSAIKTDDTSLNGKYILLNDIYLIDDENDVMGFDADGWIPIGDEYHPFIGVFNGNFNKITNLWINRPSDRYIGLFGYIENTQIRNLGVETAEGKEIKGREYIGGIVGEAYYSNITNSYSIGNISGDSSYCIGGIVGYLGYGSIINSYSIGDIGGYSEYIGGIAGEVINGNITNSYSVRSIGGNYLIGGIAGYVSNAVIQNNAAINPSIAGTNSVNRIIGDIGGFSTVSNNFAKSALDSGFSNFVEGNEWSGTGKADNEFLDEDTYRIGLDWDFTNIWKMPSSGGYPILKWQKE